MHPVTIKPILKWAGSKRALAETVRRAFDSTPAGHCEPFVGAGAVYLHRLSVGELRPGPHVVLADLCAPLVAFYRGVQADPAGVGLALDRLHWGLGWRDQYNDRRDEYNGWAMAIGPDHVAFAESAARFLWLNRACFNGLYRVSSTGKFNTPAGSYATLSRPTAGQVHALSEALAGVQLVCGSYQHTLRMERDWGSQVYVDPPYFGMFDQYTPVSWEYDEQVRLALACTDARARGAHVVASNSDHPKLRALWAGLGFDVRDASVYHSVGAKGDRRTRAKEVVMVGMPPRKKKNQTPAV